MGLLGSIAGGLLGAGSSAIKNSQNRQNVRETNQMNYKINQMNNQFNERMAIQQRNWQENMWNKENAYNTASAQRQRLEEAGLNPYMMMNGGSAGVAQSAGLVFHVQVHELRAQSHHLVDAFDEIVRHFVTETQTFAHMLVQCDGTLPTPLAFAAFQLDLVVPLLVS